MAGCQCGYTFSRNVVQAAASRMRSVRNTLAAEPVFRDFNVKIFNIFVRRAVSASTGMSKYATFAYIKLVCCFSAYLLYGKHCNMTLICQAFSRNCKSSFL